MIQIQSFLLENDVVPFLSNNSDTSMPNYFEERIVNRGNPAIWSKWWRWTRTEYGAI